MTFFYFLKCTSMIVKRTFTVWLLQPHPLLKELLLCGCHNYIVRTSQLDTHTKSDVVVATTTAIVPNLTIFCGCDNQSYVTHIHRVFSVYRLWIGPSIVTHELRYILSVFDDLFFKSTVKNYVSPFAKAT